MTDNLHTRPQFAHLLKDYARDLAETAPSPDLDARIDDLVATCRWAPVSVPGQRHRRTLFYASAAGIAVVAIGVGIFIGMKLEHARKASANLANARDTAWSPADLTMWPTDSVSFKVPAEYSAQGNLVAVDPDSPNARYWIDVVVANDGTFRIERIVPADAAQKRGGLDGVAPQVQ